MKILKRIDNSRFYMEIRRSEYQKEQIIETRPITNNDNIKPIDVNKKYYEQKEYIAKMEMINPEKADELKENFLNSNFKYSDDSINRTKINSKKINEPIPYGGNTNANESKNYNFGGTNIGITIKRS